MPPALNDSSLDDFGPGPSRSQEGGSTGGRTFRAYFASALTGIDPEALRELHDIRSAAQRECQACDIDLYVPMDYTSPVLHAEVSPAEVFGKDREQVATADVVVLVANRPSFGAGQELEIARNALVPIVALHAKGISLSRMVHGSPTFKVMIPYERLDEIEPKLRRELALISPLFEEARRARSLATRQLIGSNIAEERRRKDLTQQQLADRVGISAEEVRIIEEDQVEISNPSLITLSKMANILEVPLAALVNPGIAETSVRIQADLRKPIEAFVVGARLTSTLTAKDRKFLKDRLEKSIHRKASRE